MSRGELGKLDSADCANIGGAPLPVNPAHRPAGSFAIWRRRIEAALAMDAAMHARDAHGARTPSNHEIAEDVGAKLGMSARHVKRAYSEYVLEPNDPNGAARRDWRSRTRTSSD
ncbi:hypothetical protein [Aromatoleum toluclasticum]|uniref:hypothetical protein n=1 Tax=Aromatoleum toluclasticum TaxID=92003 RepID=UPI00038269FF|nr:hypothetical protein [Aromatoleum toluclasticum]